jgi:energy-converting hydrogenase Eha subunit F
MRFSLALAIVIVAASLSGFAQQKNELRVKPAPKDHTAKKSTVAPGGKSGVAGTSAASNLKNLQALEHQTAKTSASRSTVRKTPATAAVKPVKDKQAPPIKEGGVAKGTNLTRQNSNPYKGRLKQKYGRQ